jgi:hypothetical protein
MYLLLDIFYKKDVEIMLGVLFFLSKLIHIFALIKFINNS